MEQSGRRFRLGVTISTTALQIAINAFNAITANPERRSVLGEAIGYMENGKFLTKEQAGTSLENKIEVMLNYILYYFFTRTLRAKGIRRPSDEEVGSIYDYLFDREYIMPHGHAARDFLGFSDEFKNDKVVAVSLELLPPMARQWMQQRQRTRAAAIISKGKFHVDSSDAQRDMMKPSLSGRARMHLEFPGNDQGAKSTGQLKLEFDRNYWPRDGVGKDDGRYFVISVDAYPFPMAIFSNRVGFVLPNTRPGRPSLIVASARFPNDASILVDEHRASFFVDDQGNFHITGHFSRHASGGIAVAEIVIHTANLLASCRADFHSGTLPLWTSIDSFEKKEAYPEAKFRMLHPANLAGPHLLHTVFMGQEAWVFGTHHVARGVIPDSVNGTYQVGELRTTILDAPLPLMVNEISNLIDDQDAPQKHHTLWSGLELAECTQFIKKYILDPKGGQRGCVDAEIIHSPLIPDNAQAGAILRLRFLTTASASSPLFGLVSNDGQVIAMDAFFVVRARYNSMALTLQLCLADLSVAEDFIVDTPTRPAHPLRLLAGRCDAFTIALLEGRAYRFVDVQWIRAFTDATQVSPNNGIVAIHMPKKPMALSAMQLGQVQAWSHSAGIISVTVKYDDITPRQEDTSSGVAMLAMVYSDVNSAYVLSPRTAILTREMTQAQRLVPRGPRTFEAPPYQDLPRCNSGCFHRRWYVAGFKRLFSDPARFSNVNGLYIADYSNDDEDELPNVPSVEELQDRMDLEGDEEESNSDEEDGKR